MASIVDNHIHRDCFVPRSHYPLTSLASVSLPPFPSPKFCPGRIIHSPTLLHYATLELFEHWWFLTTSYNGDSTLYKEASFFCDRHCPAVGNPLTSWFYVRPKRFIIGSHAASFYSVICPSQDTWPDMYRYTRFTRSTGKEDRPVNLFGKIIYLLLRYQLNLQWSCHY